MKKLSLDQNLNDFIEKNTLTEEEFIAMQKQLEEEPTQQETKTGGVTWIG